MIAGIVLAAGKSTRMGRPKALLPIGDNETFLSRILTTLDRAGLCEIVVVVGHDRDAIQAARENRRNAITPVRFVFNAQYERGQLSSLLAGLAAIDRPDVEAALVTLVDVPLVSAATVLAVIDGYRRTDAPLVRPVRSGHHGHPVLFDRALFPELRAANPEEGAKPIVRRHASNAGDVEVTDDGAFADVDTPAEYARVTGVSLDRR